MLESAALRLLIGAGTTEAQAEAVKLLARRRMAGGRTSTLRKARRAHRIAAGLRPRIMPRKVAIEIVRRGVRGELTYTLHPTRGAREPKFTPFKPLPRDW